MANANGRSFERTLRIFLRDGAEKTGVGAEIACGCGCGCSCGCGFGDEAVLREAAPDGWRYQSLEYIDLGEGLTLDISGVALADQAQGRA